MDTDEIIPNGYRKGGKVKKIKQKQKQKQKQSQKVVVNVNLGKRNEKRTKRIEGPKKNEKRIEGPSPYTFALQDSGFIRLARPEIKSNEVNNPVRLQPLGPSSGSIASQLQNSSMGQLDLSKEEVRNEEVKEKEVVDDRPADDEEDVVLKDKEEDDVKEYLKSSTDIRREVLDRTYKVNELRRYIMDELKLKIPAGITAKNQLIQMVLDVELGS